MLVDRPIIVTLTFFEFKIVIEMDNIHIIVKYCKTQMTNFLSKLNVYIFIFV